MPPKKAPEPSKKTEMKKKEKIVEVMFCQSLEVTVIDCLACTNLRPDAIRPKNRPGRPGPARRGLDSLL